MIRLGHFLKWLPPLALTTSVWLFWGAGAFLSIIPGAPSLVLPRMPWLQHLDAALVGLFYFVTLYRTGTGHHRVPFAWQWHVPIWIFFAVGVLSMAVNGAPVAGAAGMMISLGRNGLYWAGLSMLRWNAADERTAGRVVRGLAWANLLAVLAQSLIFFVARRQVGVPGDYALGALGFANDAALVSLTWACGLLLRHHRRPVQAFVFFLTGLASAYLTGTVAVIAAAPIVWLLVSKRRTVGAWVKITAVALAAVFTLLGAAEFYSTFYATEVAGYGNAIGRRTPGFIKGLGLVSARLLQDPVDALIGLGPGLVNSRAVGRLKLKPKVDGIVLAYDGEAPPLTYHQMNQSYLVTLAETGLVGLACIGGFWLAVTVAVGRSIRRQRRYDGVSLARFSAVVTLLLLGVMSIYWNESPLGYVTLLTAAPLVFEPRAKPARAHLESERTPAGSLETLPREGATA